MPRWAEWVAKRQDIVFTAAVIAVLATIFVPLPPPLLDLLLVVSITISALVLFTAITVKEPLRFSVFPSVLLLTTAYRLALNVAVTRQILSNAKEAGTGAAGRVVETFGTFVAGSEPLVGFVVFAIIMIVNLIVITKGSTRIAEVAARFTLDAIPGKQMAIDADLNAGIIKEDEARRRREQLDRQSSFYGAMDGASKFVRGDAVAGILITFINIAAGFAIGWLRYDMSAAEALRTFTVLTIGDGLVAAVPALMVSLAAGLMVTRSGTSTDLGTEFLGQLLGEKRVLIVAAVFLVLLVVTGLPVLPLLGVAALLGLILWGSGAAAKDRVRSEAAKKELEPAAPAKPERVEGLLHLDPMEMEIGVGLIRLAEPAQGGTLLDRVSHIRRQMAVDLGLVVPPIRIRDNMQLRPNQYTVKLRGVTLAGGEVMPDRFLAMDTGAAAGPAEGIEAREPAFGLKAYWVTAEQRAGAEELGYTVSDAVSVLTVHMTEILKQHAHELLTRDEVNNLIKNLKETSPSVVEEVVPGVMKPGEIQKVLQNLLREGVSIRDLGTILEAIGDLAPRTKDPDVLTEYVRTALSRAICRGHVGKDGKMYVITLDPKLEDLIKSATERGERGGFLALTPALIGRIAARLGAEVEKLAAAGHPAVILCSPQARAQVKRVADTIRPGISVLSYNEIVQDVKVEALGMVAVEPSPI